MNQQRHRISIIIPFLNEAESLSVLLDRTLEVLDCFSPASEILLIDDGSTDNGAEIVSKYAEKDRRVKLIQFRRNYGQTAAWAAGIEHARGEYVVFMDADMQNDPADIRMMVSKIDEGYDVVSGWRKARKDKLFSRRIPSWIANKMISRVVRVPLHDFGCSLKIYKREAVKDVKLYGEMHRFLPAYAAWEGARITEVPVTHRARRYGKSKYGLARVFKVLLDLTTVSFLGGFATKPIYFFGALGAGSFLFGTASFAVVAYRVLVLRHLEATPLIFLMVIFFLASLQFILMGLLAEISVRIYHDVLSKSVYRIRSTKNI